MTIAVVDLRRPCAALPAALRKERWDEVRAMTPLAAWRLEEAGIPFATDAGIADAGWFRRECRENLARLGRAFDAFSEPEGWLGLMYPLKMAADYGLAESRRLRAFAGRDARLFTDVRPATGAGLWEHVLNAASLYHGAFAPGRVTEVPRRWEGPARLRRRLAGLTWDKLKARLAAEAPAQRPALVTSYGYDWAPYREELSARCAAVSAATVAKEARAAGAADDSAAERARFLGTLRRELAPAMPEAWEDVERLARGAIESYAGTRAAVRANLPEIVRRRRIAGALGTFCGTDEDFLVARGLKELGLPSVFYQHGGYMGESDLIRTAEVVPATLNVVYGEADRRLLSGWRKDGSVLAAGCAGLPRELGRPRAGDYLYVLLNNLGNASNADGPHVEPTTDATELFRRHRAVLELFGARPRLSLTVREHPAQHQWGLYEPLRELVARRGWRNVRFDDHPAPSAEFLRGREGVILDYVCTTLLPCLSGGARLACYTGGPYRFPPSPAAVLARTALCADDHEVFVSRLARWLEGERGPEDAAARRGLLELYGGTEHKAGELRAALDRALAGAEAVHAR